MEQMPPPYAPMQKRTNTTLIIVLAVLGVFALCCVGLLAAGGFGLFRGFQQVAPMAECVVGFEQVHESVLAYARDNDNKLPKADTWMDDVRKYVVQSAGKYKQQLGPFKPLDPNGEWGCSSADGGKTGMAFNTDLSGKKLTDIKDKSVPLIFEIEAPAMNANEPFQKRDDATSPKIMGERRGWIVYPIEGEMTIGKERGRVRVGTNAGFKVEPSSEK